MACGRGALSGVLCLRAALSFALALAGLAGESSRADSSCGALDKKCAINAQRDHVIKKIGFWQPAFSLPVEQRIGPAPPALVEFVSLDNIKNDIPNKPRSATVAPDFLRDIQDAVAGMPAQVKIRLSRKLAGIYFVDDLGGSAFADMIFDADNNPVAAFILMDPAVLNKTANEWATWKENTPFKPDPAFRLLAQIEEQSGDDRKNAIQYILLHEIGHVLSVGEKIHPRWDAAPKDVKSPDGYAYMQSSWYIDRDEDKYLTIFDLGFPQRREARYYFGAKLRADQMQATYDNLERTNLATLYSANNPADDFAEAFANYVHVVLLKRPFLITIYRDGKAVKAYRACWEQRRCAEKKKIIERFLEGK